MADRNGEFFQGRVSHEHDPDIGGVTISAHEGEEQVGSMDLRGNGSVSYLSVKTRHQRKGVATAMWMYAKDNGLNPQHSPQSQTPEGKTWANKVGN